jgi:hypothetical protein
MDMLKALAQFFFFCTALLSTEALAQTDQTVQRAQPAQTIPGAQTIRTNLTRLHVTTMGAIAGRQTTFGDWYGIGLDCLSWDWEEIIISTAPQHGHAQVISKNDVVNFPDSNPRKICNGRQVASKALTYTPDKTYSGTDMMVVQKVSASGVMETATYNITVLQPSEGTANNATASENSTDK